METLILDLGSDTGWVRQQGATIIQSGTLHLATDDELELQRREGRERTLDVRFARLHGFIVGHLRDGVERIVFEDVEFASTRMQSQLWASFRTAIWSAALLYPGVSIFGLPVGTLKKFACGNGSAKKVHMARALVNLKLDNYAAGPNDSVRKPDGTIADDNEIDAIWLAFYTAAVDRGERDFLSVYQRKELDKLERRKKKAQRKQLAKAKMLAAKAMAMAKACPANLP